MQRKCVTIAEKLDLYSEKECDKINQPVNKASTNDELFLM